MTSPCPVLNMPLKSALRTSRPFTRPTSIFCISFLRCIAGPILRRTISKASTALPAAKNTPGYDEFHSWRRALETEHGIIFHATVADVPPQPSSSSRCRRLAIISARTADNPALFSSCINDAHCHAIFLKKPGAPTLSALERMRDTAREANVAVFMVFNKNVSSYVAKARSYVTSNASPSSSSHRITFVHNNSYNESDLPECFERNAEGMLKNMIIHELALLVTYYGVTVETIANVTADASYSRCLALEGPSSKRTFTDFDKLKFRITTEDDQTVDIAADRCGGDDSVGIVTDVETGIDVASFVMPDEATVANVPNLERKYPGAMPYFFAQDPDYREVKVRVVQWLVESSSIDDIDEKDVALPEGVATIEVACETLRVAEYLTPILQKQLLAGE